MTSNDTMYVPLPFFHTNALALSWPTVFVNGSAVAIRRKFSVSNFWKDVRQYHVTAWCYIGELCRYLMNHSPQPDDNRNPLTKIIGYSAAKAAIKWYGLWYGRYPHSTLTVVDPAPVEVEHHLRDRLHACEQAMDLLDTRRDPSAGKSASQAYVRVMRGCDNFCSYCIVPATRGTEVSRPIADIVDESRRLIDDG